MSDKPKEEPLKLLAKLGENAEIQIQKRGGVSKAGEKEQFKLILVCYQHSLRSFIQKGRISSALSLCKCHNLQEPLPHIHLLS